MEDANRIKVVLVEKAYEQMVYKLLSTRLCMYLKITNLLKVDLNKRVVCEGVQTICSFTGIKVDISQEKRLARKDGNI